MKKSNSKLILFVSFVALFQFILIEPAFADPFSELENPVTGNGFTTIEEYATLAVNVMLGIAISISFIGVILSGIKYMSAKSDFKAVAAAKLALTYSIVGLLLSIGVFGLLNIIVGII